MPTPTLRQPEEKLHQPPQRPKDEPTFKLNDQEVATKNRAPDSAVPTLKLDTENSGIDEHALQVPVDAPVPQLLGDLKQRGVAKKF